MISVSFLSKTIQLISCKNGPMFLISICFRFQEALALEDLLFVLLVVSEALDRFDVLVGGEVGFGVWFKLLVAADGSSTVDGLERSLVLETFIDGTPFDVWRTDSLSVVKVLNSTYS